MDRDVRVRTSHTPTADATGARLQGENFEGMIEEYICVWVWVGGWVGVCVCVGGGGV